MLAEIADCSFSRAAERPASPVKSAAPRMSPESVRAPGGQIARPRPASVLRFLAAAALRLRAAGWAPAAVAPPSHTPPPELLRSRFASPLRDHSEPTSSEPQVSEELLKI